jgi:hypothetical protein
MFGPDPFTDPAAFIALFLILWAGVEFALAKTPFL